MARGTRHDVGLFRTDGTRCEVDDSERVTSARSAYSPRPSISGSEGTDVFVGQQHGPPAELEVP